MGVSAGPAYNPQLATQMQQQQQMAMYQAETQAKREERQARERAALAAQAASGQAAAREAQARQQSQHAYEQAYYGGQARTQEAGIQSERDKALAGYQQQRDATLAQHDEQADWRRAGFQSQRDYDQAMYQRMHAQDQYGYHAALTAQEGEQQMLRGDQAAYYQHQRDVNQNQYDQQRQEQQFGHQAQLALQHGGIQALLAQQHSDLAGQLHRTQLTQTERARMERIQNEIGALDSNPNLSPEERANMRTMLQTGLDPLHQRHVQSQMLTAEMQRQLLENQNRAAAVHATTAEQMAAQGTQVESRDVQNPDGTTRRVHFIRDASGQPHVLPDHTETERNRQLQREETERAHREAAAVARQGALLQFHQHANAAIDRQIADFHHNALPQAAGAPPRRHAMEDETARAAAVRARVQGAMDHWDSLNPPPEPPAPPRAVLPGETPPAASPRPAAPGQTVAPQQPRWSDAFLADPSRGRPGTPAAPGAVRPQPFSWADPDHALTPEQLSLRQEASSLNDRIRGLRGDASTPGSPYHRAIGQVRRARDIAAAFGTRAAMTPEARTEYDHLLGRINAVARRNPRPEEEQPFVGPPPPVDRRVPGNQAVPVNEAAANSLAPHIETLRNIYNRGGNTPLAMLDRTNEDSLLGVAGQMHTLLSTAQGANRDLLPNEVRQYQELRQRLEDHGEAGAANLHLPNTTTGASRRASLVGTAESIRALHDRVQAHDVPLGDSLNRFTERSGAFHDLRALLHDVRGRNRGMTQSEAARYNRLRAILNRPENREAGYGRLHDNIALPE